MFAYRAIDRYNEVSQFMTGKDLAVHVLFVWERRSQQQAEEFHSYERLDSIRAICTLRAAALKGEVVLYRNNFWKFFNQENRLRPTLLFPEVFIHISNFFKKFSIQSRLERNKNAIAIVLSDFFK